MENNTHSDTFVSNNPQPIHEVVDKNRQYQELIVRGTKPEAALRVVFGEAAASDWSKLKEEIQG